jgi:hypothetical protein
VINRVMNQPSDEPINHALLDGEFSD